jgi:hypothetical protein
VKLGFDLLPISNVTIDFNHGAVIEQLLAAFYNDFAAILAGMAQIARPVTLRRKAIKPLGLRSRAVQMANSIGNFV